MRKKEPPVFEEITARRINVVNEDGTVQVVISGKDRAPDWSIDCARFKRLKAAGMIFYNEEGCECGGLQFSGVKGESVEARASWPLTAIRTTR